MRNLFVCLGLCLLSVAALSRQDIMTPKGSNSDATLLKIRQIDLLDQLLPLGMKKEQYNPLLLAIEKARANEKKIRTMEDDDLAKIDPELTDAVKAGLEKGAFPNHNMQVRADRLLKAMSIRRQVAIGENVDTVYEAVKANFDEGQLTVMEKSLDIAAFDPTIKKDSLDRTGKIRFFVNRVFLDPVTYELLVKLQRTAS